MNDDSLFEATVPVFKHYLLGTNELLSKIPNDAIGKLDSRLATKAFTAAEHLETSIGFVSRTVHPLLGLEALDSLDKPASRTSLTRLVDSTTTWLDKLSPIDFIGSSERVIRHTAGDAELEQDATAFVTVFALPNYFFHLGQGFAILRGEGILIGKADFDKLHAYDTGFHF